MKEEWKSIPNYEKYEISNWGRVRKIIKNGYKFCNLRKNKKGYLLISLWNKKYGIKTLSIHRLVAKEFIPNPLNLPQVNHKNEIKIDNKVNNLEYLPKKSKDAWLDIFKK